MPLVRRSPHHPVVEKRTDQSRRLRRAHPCYFFHVGAHYTPLPLPQLAIALRSQHSLHPGVFLLPFASRELDRLARLEKLPDLFPAQALGILHAHLHPAAPRLPHSSLLPAHLVLDNSARAEYPETVGALDYPSRDIQP